jgi:hypothetical protein
MEQNIKNTLNDYANFLLKLLLALVILYGFFYIFKPNTSMSSEDKQRIDSLILKVNVIQEEQKKLDTNILKFEEDVELISDRIHKIKKDKSIIREVYHDQILRVSTFNDSQIDSFFTARYGHNPH